VAKKHGVKVYYLGQNVPFHDLVSVAQAVEPDLLATYFVSAISHDALDHYLKELESNFPKQHILISGMQAANIDFQLSEYTKLISSAIDFKQFIKTQQV
jgi:methanogenic corrinoid protein MtbC1